MRELNSREKVIFVICVVLGAVFIVVQLVIRPMRLKEESLDRLIENKTVELEKTKKVLQSASVIQEKYNKQLELLGTKGSDQEEVAGFISDIESVARERNIAIQNLQPQRITLKGNFKKFAVQMTVDGNLNDIAAFFHTLQNAPYFVSPEEVVIERQSTSQQTLRGRFLLSRMKLVPPS